MSQVLVVSSNPIGTTVAVVEDDRLVEVVIELESEPTIVGSIYKGRVRNVRSGMQSAFVDIGLSKDAFLHVDDVVVPDSSDADNTKANATEDKSPRPLSAGDTSGGSDGSGKPKSSSRRRRRRRRRAGRGTVEPAGIKAAPDTSAEGPVTERPDGSALESHVDDRRTVLAEDNTREPLPPILPGESVAKYRGKSSASARSADSAVSEAPAGRTEEANGHPQEKASVSGPNLVAEFRLNIRDWFRSGKAKEKPEEKPVQKPQPQRGRRPSGTETIAGGRRGGARPHSRQSRQPPSKASRPTRRPRRGGRRRHSRPHARDQSAVSPKKTAAPPKPTVAIADLLKEGQGVVVQVNREPIEKKGARITANVSLPGRFVIYTPTTPHSGVSKSIRPDSERNRLRDIVKRSSEGQPGSFVVRTAASGVSEEDLVADMNRLSKIWTEINEKAGQRSAPSKLHSDIGLVEKILREYSGDEFNEIWVDSGEVQRRIQRFTRNYRPELTENVKLHTGSEPIFDRFGVTPELTKALKRRVWLKSGGHLNIDQTEAMVVIDVNTGKYTGKSDSLEDTVLMTNIEAAKEIARQVRLRDLGGIIAIDFIDMEVRKNRIEVQNVLNEALQKTRSPFRMEAFNEFGVIMITRKSKRQSLERALCERCPTCSGTGMVKSPFAVLSEVFATATRKQAKSGKGEEATITLRAHPSVTKVLKGRSARRRESLEEIAGASVVIQGNPSLQPDEFTLS